MNPDENPEQPQTEEEGPMAEAPSQRAKALREEMFGSALTLDEAAYILSLDRTTVAKYLREKTLYGFQIGREWLIPEEELRAYVRRMTQSAARDDAADIPREGIIAQRGILERMRQDLLGARKRAKEEGPPKGTSPEKMSARFDKFTERARKVLTLAQEEARSFNHNYIGTEHLLLGLVREGDGIASRVLTNLGVELYRVRSAVEFIIGRGDRVVSGQVSLTPRAKKVIELGVDEARRLGHHYIGTEHLLLGLVREGEGIAAGVLESLGVGLELVRTETIRVLARAAGEAEAQPMSPPPPEAASLVGQDTQATTCLRCDARCPAYFQYCFNCGARLQHAEHAEHAE